jgi:4-methylaminobutanoate oxidase (formaldehyde-forming)
MYPRAIELYGHHYKIHYPGLEHESARGIRRSPLYHLLKEKGAVYGSKAGWERPNWFALQGVEREDRSSFRRPNWFEPVAAEHRCVRERVALIDQSSFSKFELVGTGALAAIDRLAAARMAKPVGSVVYTQLCNEHGGIECDLTITRLAEDRFYIVTGSGFAVHDSHWIGQHLPQDGAARLIDVTSSRAVINLCGPRARQVLERVAEEDVSNAAFPFATARFSPMLRRRNSRRSGSAGSPIATTRSPARRDAMCCASRARRPGTTSTARARGLMRRPPLPPASMPRCCSSTLRTG